MNHRLPYFIRVQYGCFWRSKNDLIDLFFIG